MKRLAGVRKTYAWGSTSAIQDFLGEAADGDPLAEIWFGAHQTAPSPIEGRHAGTTLLDLITDDPAGVLGQRLADDYGTLPYLLKLLAPGQAVSLQVHPSRRLAERGFAAEDYAGVPLTAGHRTYKDRNHKPEMVYALTSFDGLVGFRSVPEARSVLRHLSSDLAQKMLRDLDPADDHDAMTTALRTAVQDGTKAQVEQVIAECAALAETRDPDVSAASEGYRTVVELATTYPGDVGAVASLLMSRVRLAPGAATFVPDGMPHAYISGLCVELMANSDNVIRAGLTAKHIDTEALLAAINTTDRYALLQPRPLSARTIVFAPKAAEFTLAVADVADSDSELLPGSGPRVVLAVRGKVNLTCGGERLNLVPGQAVFAQAGEGPLCLTGQGTAVEAFVPES
jgi:mannose-6-phosphate isomerase